MQIACIPNSERQSVLTIICDGQPWRDVHTVVFGRRPSLPQECSSLEEFSKQFAVLEYKQAKNYAIRRLSLQSMLSTALSGAMKERMICGKVIAQIIEELITLGFLNDGEWTASFVRSQALRKVGPRAIAKKLRNKGVKGQQLETALEKSWNPEEQKALIIKLLQSRYAKRNLSDFKEKQKVIAALIRKGFDFSVILNCIGFNMEIE